MAMVYFNRTKQIGSITIKYSNLNDSFVNNIESIIKETAANEKVNLKNANNNVTIYIYHSGMKSYFNKMFGEILHQREKYGAKAQMNVVTNDDGSIHILMGAGLGSGYLTKLIVAKVFEQIVDSKKISSVSRTIKSVIDKREKKEEPEEEIEEEIEKEPEEEIEETDVREKIEDIIDEKKIELPEWLVRGYERYPGYMNAARSNDLAEHLQTHKVGNVDKMSDKTGLTEEYNWKNELECIKVEYIIKTYGMKLLLKFFENPNIKDVFKISKTQFNDDWKQYVKDTYFKEPEKTKEGKDFNREIENKQEKIIE